MESCPKVWSFVLRSSTYWISFLLSEGPSSQVSLRTSKTPRGCRNVECCGAPLPPGIGLHNPPELMQTDALVLTVPMDRHRCSSFCTWPTYLPLSPESFSRCRLRWTTPPSPQCVTSKVTLPNRTVLEMACVSVVTNLATGDLSVQKGNQAQQDNLLLLGRVTI